MCLGAAYLFSLEVLEDTAKRPLGGAQSSVESMNIGLLQIGGLFGAEANLQSARLVIRTVGARDKLFVFLLEGEPCFQIVLLGCGIVQRAGDNGHNLVR